MYPRIQQCFDFISILLVTASLFFLTCYNIAHGEPLSKESIPLLERIGNEYSANRDRIRTWRGKIEFTRKVGTAGNGPLKEVEKAVIRFVYDGEKQRWLSLREQTWVGEQGKELLFQSAMLADDGYYIYDSYSPEHFPHRFLPTLRIHTAAEGRETNRIKWAGDFRPLDTSTTGGDVSGLMLGYAKLLKEGEDLTKRRTLTRNGNLAKVRIESPDLINEYVFDLDTSCSLVEFVSKGSNPSLVWKCKIEKVNGVFVPRELTSDVLRGKEREVQEMRWIDHILNEPISKDEFTIVNMGVHRGDRVHDYRTDAEYELTDGKLPPQSTPGIARELRQTAKRPSHLPHYLFLVGLFLLAAVVSLIIYRRRRSPQARG
jgi:hypothetical protein